MHHVENALAAHANFLLIDKGVHDPVKRLLRRRDVVATAGKHDDGRANRLQVQQLAWLQLRQSLGEAVADKQLLDDPGDFGLVGEVKTTPPFFELQKALALVVHIGKQVVVLAKEIAAGVEHLEVGHQVGTIKLARTQIGGQHGRQHAAHQATVVAHRTLANLARPGSHRGSIEHQRTR